MVRVLENWWRSPDGVLLRLTAWKSSLPSQIMFTDGDRSAVPTMNELMFFASGLITWPPDTLDAVSAVSKVFGTNSFQSWRISPRIRACNSCPSSGNCAQYLSRSCSHSRTKPSPRCGRSAKNPRTSSPITKCFSGSMPLVRFMFLTSSAPNGAPWDAALPATALPRPMVVLMLMKVGLSLDCLALASAWTMPLTS